MVTDALARPVADSPTGYRQPSSIHTPEAESPALLRTISPRTLNFDLAGIYPPEEAAPPSPTASSSTHASPTLDPRQQELVHALNSITHLRKHIAFFPDVFTSHTVIICQDEKKEELKPGLGVVKHWADGLDL